MKRWIAEACGSSRICSHSGRNVSIPSISSSVSQTGSSPGPLARSRTSPSRAAAGHGVGSGAPSRTRRAAVVGARTASRSAASAAARSSKEGSSPGLVPASSTISPRESAMPGATRSRAGVRRPFSPVVRVVTESVRRHARRER